MSSASSGGRHNQSSGGEVAFGVATFAGVLLVVLAVFQIIDGISAIANDTVFVRGLSYTWEFDVTAWGWIHLIIGLIALGTGIGIIMGQTWGFLVGIVIAALSALANFMFMPHYPLWALVLIAFDLFVIWSLSTVRGARR